jgi:hypothetical protein
MSKPLEIVLLLALPASGKSEVRKYLESLSGAEALRDFHMGSTVQLDDYPYVHLMRRISEELRHRDQDGIFFDSDLLPLKDGRDWGTLIELVNEDYDDLLQQPVIRPAQAALWLLDRYDAARRKVGAEPAFGKLPPEVRGALAAAIEADARQLLDDKRAEMAKGADMSGKTVVIEFARGGPDGRRPPLAAPLGYQYSLGRLCDGILQRARILYIWVTPEESRRKNEERAKPGRDGDASILHHGVPICVMLGDYGMDDMAYLVDASDRPGTVRVESRGQAFHLPVARFDNRVDKTSFIRGARAAWPAESVRVLHAGLAEAFAHLAAAGR